MILTALAAQVALAAPPFDAGPGEHALEAANPPYVARRRGAPLPLPPVTPGPDVVVYGYQAYWANDLNLVPWDQLTHMAIFAASVDSSGNLAGTSKWNDAATAVSMGAPYGVRIHLCVTNFDGSSIAALLASTTARQRLIDSLVQWTDDTGAVGVNIDFEGLPVGSKQDMVDFVADLDAAVDDVVLATPAVDWNGAWDYSELSKHADLFIMGYGYHWSGSSSAGPVDPLYSGDLWTSRDLDWTVKDYLANGADPSRVILGLPLYGYSWQTASSAVPADTTSTGTAVLWADANANAATYGMLYDEISVTPYYYGAGKQGWYGNTDSLRERIRYAVDANIEGVGFWALEYDGGDAAMWSMVAEETKIPLPDDPAPADSAYTADAGRPFLAYPGDRVILTANGSTGPDGVELQYLWTQVAGPHVSLSAEHIKEPSFIADLPGVHVFELRVGDGVTFSAPARSEVIVVDRDAGEAHDATGGCSTTSGGLLAGLIALLAARKRRA